MIDDPSERKHRTAEQYRSASGFFADYFAGRDFAKEDTTTREEYEAEVADLTEAAFEAGNEVAKLADANAALQRSLTAERRLSQGLSRQLGRLQGENRVLTYRLDHSTASKLRRRVVGGIVALALLGGGFYMGYLWEHNAPACHSVTEDSTITDCDYRDGGWYPDD